jgi:hypothetical protein
MQLAFIAMAIGALPVRSCLPQYFGPKNTGEDCELADKKKNDNRVLHDLLLYRPPRCRRFRRSEFKFLRLIRRLAPSRAPALRTPPRIAPALLGPATIQEYADSR